MARWQNNVERDADAEAVRDRRLVAEVLNLDPKEIAGPLADADGDGFVIIEFARRYGQSLDWLFCNDVRGLIAARALK